jgi:hypothetical protein
MTGLTINRGLQDPELLELARAELARAEESATCLALAGEMLELQRSRSMPVGIAYDARRARDGRPIFIVACDNGWHESFDGFEAALSLLVESHRTHVEDLESTHLAVMAQNPKFDLKLARAHCAKVALEVRAENPGAKWAERDALVRAALDIDA